MTALDQYHRLEAPGIWQETPEDQRRNVIVSIGDATLIIATQADQALTHWSLPAIERLNPGHSPALYAPGADSAESLEIDDEEMVAAIEKLRSAIDRHRPHPGRLRFWIILASVVCGLVLTVFWLPGALTRQTVALLPDPKREEIGELLMQEIGLLAGEPCRTARGGLALERLGDRVFGPEPAPRIFVLPRSIPETLALPGNIIVVTAALAEDHETPEVIAGHLLAADVHRDMHSPLTDLLEGAGLAVTFRLLTTGEMSQEALRDHAVVLLGRPEGQVPDELLLQRFAQARISSVPYAFATDVSGETVLPLIEGDPMRGQNAPDNLLMTDADWISLQEICSE